MAVLLLLLLAGILFVLVVVLLLVAQLTAIAAAVHADCDPAGARVLTIVPVWWSQVCAAEPLPRRVQEDCQRRF